MKLSPEIKIKEWRLNIQHQYSENLAYLLVDIPVQSILNKYLYESMKKCLKSLDSKPTGRSK